jgi:hypothetical protein
MAVTVNPTLMPLRLAKPTLQIEVVTRQVRLVTADKQTRLEAPHHRRHLSPDRVCFGSQTLAKRLEEGPTLVAQAARRIEGGGDLDGIKSPVDEPGQPTQERLGSPPFFASRFRPRDCLTSPNASAIRNPGG